MAIIAGHRITTKIYESASSLVYRSKRLEDGVPVILKVLKEDYPSPEELTRYRQEYEITSSLDIPGCIETYGQAAYRHTLVMFLEDFGGDSLKLRLQDKAMSIAEFLDVACKATAALKQIHADHVIHKDINPSNIVMNGETGVLKIIDFGISTRFKHESKTPIHPKVMEGTPAYVSPEQTGRMNCTMDYRTDLYSLGVTFYECLTGRLPFVTDDMLELVHHHLVNEPEPPVALRPDLPDILSRIVMRLMAKRPEDRYQSAGGLLADLETCAAGWAEARQITSFPLGSQDISDRFEIPSKLYGRTREKEKLSAAFDHAASSGVLMLVAGYSGIGKTALVQELYKPVTARRGFFTSGKFDQLQREIPYAAPAAAFRSLVRQLLTGDPDQLEHWQEVLSGALGPNGRVITEIIPELTHIIGDQPVLPELGPVESRNRFTLTFLNFLRCFCRPEHPLVLFLDDLQWVDAASLSLLESILTDQDNRHLLVIGAYRDNEVESHHPLIFFKERILKSGTLVEQINLGPLRDEDLTALTADAVKEKPETVGDLASLIRNKTLGNPFFVNQFLTTLHEEGLLFFDNASARWRWDLPRITAMDITGNVVDLLIGRFMKLPETTREVLRLAACIGNSFDLKTLAAIYEQSPVQTYGHLLPAVQESLVLPRSELQALGSNPAETDLVIFQFKFLHDRVQQAAYALIDETDREALHYRIGNLLLAQIPEEEQDERVFELLDHLNLGKKFCTDAPERERAARFNLTAGTKALGSNAYDAALTYLTTGLSLIHEEEWDRAYDLVMDLLKQTARAQYLTGDFEEAGRTMTRALQTARSDMEKVDIHQLAIIQKTTVGRYAEAIEDGRKALALLGDVLPETVSDELIEAELAACKKNLGGRPVLSLVDAPEMTDPIHRTMITILSDLISASFLSSPSIYIVITAKMVNLSLLHGNTLETSSAYSSYGMMLSAFFADYSTAYEFGSLSRALSDKYGNANLICLNYFLTVGYTSSWREPLADTITDLDRGYQAGLEAGNLNFAGYTLDFRTRHRYYHGKPLPELSARDIPSTLKFVEKREILIALDQIISTRLAVSTLTGEQEHADYLTREAGLKHLEQAGAHQSHQAIFHAYLFQAQVLYLLGRPEKALDNILKALEAITFAGGTFSVAEHNFYHSLILAELIGQGLGDTAAHWETLRANQEQMAQWAEMCPENFRHKYQLVTAETQRLEDRFTQAMDSYDTAVETAERHNFPQDEALCNELAARFWLARGKQKIAGVYLRDAHQGYRNWGATRKVNALEKAYPQWLGQSKRRVADGEIRVSTTTTGHGSDLDLATVIRASRAIAAEKELSGLLARVVHISLENAGAERGYLILNRNGNLIIKAMADASKEISVRGMSQELTQAEGPQGMVQYVARTQEAVVLEDAAAQGRFTNDPYVLKHACKSVLCMPLLSQGSLIAIVFLENNKVPSAFSADRLEVLQLLLTPAAVTIENAVLKDATAPTDFSYQVGGSLPDGAASYVTRNCDRELQHSILQGRFSLVLNSRQMGKSSLRIHTMKQLQTEGVTCVAVDLTMIGSRQVTPEQWYAGFARFVLSGLPFDAEINLRSWWRERDHLSPVQRLAELFDAEILTRVSGKMAVFIDEIDTVLGLPFNTDDFFALIRAFANKHADDERYANLTFVLLGMTTPDKLIADKQRTPFNIGTGIIVEGFKPGEVSPLFAGFRDKDSDPEAILTAVLAWTGGQPFLTQKVCALLSGQETRPQPGQVSEWVGHAVRNHIITNWEAGDEPEHLKTIRDRILASGEMTRPLLELYRDVLCRDEVLALETPVVTELRLTGLVTSAWGKLRVSNPIYREVFSRQWVETALDAMQQPDHV
ncbi:MAG: AAA family ATPase [Acidobacteriota bacterium]|nr:AAA family ATPase [Acidobacteriota bacterium]